MLSNSGRANFAVHVCVAGPGAFAGRKPGEKKTNYSYVLTKVCGVWKEFVCRMYIDVFLNLM